jgi:alkylhydroperoxidase family enzyme
VWWYWSRRPPSLPTRAGGDSLLGVPNDKRAAFHILVDRILRGPGETTTEQRAEAFENAGADPLLGKVATRPTEVTDADFDRARAAGFSEDQLFELVIAAAVGQSARMYDTALAALDEAAG